MVARGSVRVTFLWDETGLRAGRTTVRRSSPPRGVDLGARPPAHAVTVELRAGDRVLYRRLLAEPIPQSAEAFDENGRRFRLSYAPPTGIVSVVVPRPVRAATVVLSAGPGVHLAQPGLAAPAGAAPRWRELARAEL